MKPMFCLRRVAEAGLACLFAATVHGAPLTITWGAQGAGGALATSAGAELPSGCLVRLGFFDQSLTEVQRSAYDVGFLDRHFTELARATTGEFDGTRFDVAGSFAQTFPADSAHLPPTLVNRTVVVWACNASSLAEATEIGIFTSSSWQLSNGLVGGLIWDLSQIEAGGLVLGSFSPTQSPTLGGQMNQLVSLRALSDDSDEDADGVPALLEDAFGMDATRPDAVLMPHIVTIGIGTQPLAGYRFRRPAGATIHSSAVQEAGGFRYTVEVSEDLRRWRVDPSVSYVHLIEAAGDGYETVTLRPPLNLTLRPDFYRLKVERLP